MSKTKKNVRILPPELALLRSTIDACFIRPMLECVSVPRASTHLVDISQMAPPYTVEHVNIGLAFLVWGSAGHFRALFRATYKRYGVLGVGSAASKSWWKLSTMGPDRPVRCLKARPNRYNSPMQWLKWGGQGAQSSPLLPFEPHLQQYEPPLIESIKCYFMPK